MNERDLAKIRGVDIAEITRRLDSHQEQLDLIANAVRALTEAVVAIRNGMLGDTRRDDGHADVRKA